MVRFQNTGTDTAFNVVIRDQLDPNLNWHSLNPLAYSHDMSINISFDGEVSFIFNDIMLPDSNVNEAASHGFVKYEIKLNEDLPLGTSIYNTANIYFDYNPAIVTNTTVNTLYLDDVSIAEITNQHHILVYPNPFSESTTVYFGEGLSENCSLHIVDLLGNQVYFQDRVTGNSLEINASTFTAGVYILVVQDLTTSEVYTKKMVVN
ncbi:MAG: T9SS type A sorting domain-containing protein [Crocinitomix sp.]|nr:T9SS type A sorting domain-containing protein [Crocinitomix sp.]